MGEAADAMTQDKTTQKEETPTAAPAPAVEILTPAEWAERLGHKAGEHSNMAYAISDQLYGWGTDAYHYAATPFRITQADYEAALKAAFEFPCAAPHAAALPESQKVRFAGFEPAAKREKR